MAGSASVLAALLLEHLNISDKPDLSLVATRLGLRIREVESVGFDGALICDRDAGKGIIAVKATMIEPTRKRFTVAHEIGHFVIPTHRDLDNICVSKEVESWQKGLKPAEVEANEFASELLLPRRLIHQRFASAEPSAERIREVAGEFEVSLTATTRRYIDLTELACAMIWSHQGAARWFHRGENFPFFLSLTDLPSPASFAGRLFAGGTAPSDFCPVSADAWLSPQDTDRVALLFEYSVLLRNYDAVLTLLWIRSPTQRDEDDERLEELDPQEFTLARKRWPGRR